MLSQFVAAFDDCFVMRYTKDGTPKEKISVRYVMGPKQRVMYDIVNQAKNITLPVISIEQKSIRRDSPRIQNKEQAIRRHHRTNDGISKIPQPVPVQLSLNVSIVAAYKEDIDQIVSNFIPWCNPYFIISWKVPDEFGLDFTDEIRSEVSWSGEVTYESPLDITAQDKYKIVANTSFTIKGWIFPAMETPVAPIYVIKSNFHAVSTSDNLYGYDSYPSLSSGNYTQTDTIAISAYPQITNEFYNGIPIRSNFTIGLSNDNNHIFYGKRFTYNNKWYLSSNKTIQNLTFEKITTFKYPVISAYRIPDQLVTAIDSSIVSISMSSKFLSSGTYTFVTSNSAGWIASPYNMIVI